MDAADSSHTGPSPAISPSDRDLMRRLAIVVLCLVLFTAAFSFLWRLYATKFYAITGEARWIWVPHRISRNVPVVFFAAHEFDLPATRRWTRIKILGDPEYTLYFNGQRIGGRRVGDDRQLDIFDVSEMARDTGNRMLVAVRSTNGVGGLLAAVDLAPEVENFIYSGRGWKLFRRWHPDLPVRDAGDAAGPMVIGKPPVGRWNFLTTRTGDAAVAPKKVLQPREVVSYRTEVPTVEIRDGVAVAGKRAVRATAYDFGPTSGRIRVTSGRRLPVPWVVETRTANAPEELTALEPPGRPFVFAPGETTVDDPERLDFRYVIVYGGGHGARAEVLQ